MGRPWVVGPWYWQKSMSPPVSVESGGSECGSGIEEHGAGAVGRVPDLELALEDVPDLGEVVLVERVVRAGVVADEAGVGLRRPLGPRMKEHFAPLPGPAERLPQPVIGVDRFHALVPLLDGIAHLILPEVRGTVRSGFSPPFRGCVDTRRSGA